jgi:hypothetical protein
LVIMSPKLRRSTPGDPLALDFGFSLAEHYRSWLKDSSWMLEFPDRLSNPFRDIGLVT